MKGINGMLAEKYLKEYQKMENKTEENLVPLVEMLLNDLFRMEVEKMVGDTKLKKSQAECDAIKTIVEVIKTNNSFKNTFGCDNINLSNLINSININ